MSDTPIYDSVVEQHTLRPRWIVEYTPPSRWQRIASWLGLSD